MASQQTEFLKLLIFPDITGVYQIDLRKAYDANTLLIDAAVKGINEALENIPDAVPIATQEIAGKVRPDGITILIDEDGIIRAAAKVDIATVESPGIIKPDGDSTTVDEDGTIHANVKDAYTKDEVDTIMRQLSNMLLSDADISDLATATNTLMGETTIFTELGDSIIVIDNLVNQILS
ncbi:MAG: hypothetical protein PHS82_03095 [Lachnospiraceae bacterium]|nr:hypothetical protein [Lachnospiraceae bacterium]